MTIQETVVIEVSDNGSISTLEEMMRKLGLSGEQASLRIKSGYENTSTSITKMEQNQRILNAATAAGFKNMDLLKDALDKLTSSEMKAASTAKNLNVVFKEQGTVLDTTAEKTTRASKAIDTVGTSSRQTSSVLNTLRGAFAGFLSILSVRELTRVTDELTSIRNSLGLIGKDRSADQIAKDFERLRDASNATGTALADNTKLYTAINASLKQYGYSSEKNLKVTEGIAYALRSVSVDGDVANRVIRQLMDGFGRGNLQMMDFRTIAGASADAANVLATALGVTREQLAKMFEAGDVSARAMADGFLKNFDKFKAAAEQTTMSVSGSLTVLNNSMLDFFNTNERGAIVTQGLSQAIQLLANNLDTAVPMVLAFLAAFALQTTIGLVTSLSTSFIAMGTALTATVIPAMAAFIATPIGLTLTAVAAAVLLLVQHFGGLAEVWEKIVSLAKYVKEALFGVGQQAEQTALSLNKATSAQNTLAAGDDARLGPSQRSILDTASRPNTPDTPGTYTLGSVGNSVLNDVPKYRDGGSWRVPGAGSVDSRLVQFMATPGEQVTVQTRKQAANSNVPHHRNGYSGQTVADYEAAQAALAAQQITTAIYATSAQQQATTQASAVQMAELTINGVTYAVDANTAATQAASMYIAQQQAFATIQAANVTASATFAAAQAQANATEYAAYMQSQATQDIAWMQARTQMDIEKLKANTQIILAAMGKGGGGGGSGGGGLAPEGSTRITSANNGADISLGARDGADFIVPGAGAVDSRYVGMMVSPGERVQVQTREQQAQERAGNGSGVRVYNFKQTITTPDPDALRRSRNQTLRDQQRSLRIATKA